VELESQLKKAVAPDDRVFESIRAYFADNPAVVCFRSSFEADHQCVAMQQDGLVQYIFSDDSDLFSIGGDMILSNLNLKVEVLQKKEKKKEAVTRNIFTAEIAEREHIFGPSWEVDTKHVKLKKGGLEYLAGNSLSQVEFFAMLGTDYQPHLSGNSFQTTHALFQAEVFGKNSRPDVSTRTYCSPRSGESAKDYWEDHKKNCTALRAAPVFGIVAGVDNVDGNSKEVMFKLASKGLIEVTLRRLHDTDATETHDWNSIGLIASHIEELKQNATAVLTMKHLPSKPNEAVRAFTKADLMLAGNDLVISPDCASLTRHSVSDVRNYLHLHNVDTSADCPPRTLIYIVKRVLANPIYYPLIRTDQLRRGDEASRIVLYTLADKPEWEALLGVYRFACKECEELDTAFFQRIFPEYPSILRRAIWLITGGRIDPAHVMITRNMSLKAGVSFSDVGVSVNGDAGCGSGASASSSSPDSEMTLVKATVVSSYQNSKYIVTVVFVKVGHKFRFSPGCSGGECVTSSVICAHILSVLMVLRMFQLFPLSAQFTYKQVAQMFPKAVKTIGTPILSDTLFKKRLGSKRLWPGDFLRLDDGTDVGPREDEQTQTLLENYNVDKQLAAMMSRSFEHSGSKKRAAKTALANKGINVEEAVADFNAARTYNSMSEVATKYRSRILGNHNRAREVYGQAVVGAPLLFDMIESGDYAVEEYRGVVEIGDFSDPRVAVVEDGESENEESSDGRESESEENNLSDSESESEENDSSDSQSESDNSDSSDSRKESADSDVNSSERGSKVAKRMRANSVTVVNDETTEDVGTKRARAARTDSATAIDEVFNGDSDNE
jgi:hypothetical protein